MSKTGKAAGAVAVIGLGEDILTIALIVLIVFLIWYYASKLKDFFGGWIFTYQAYRNGTFDGKTALSSALGYGKSMVNSLLGRTVDAGTITTSVGG